MNKDCDINMKAQHNWKKLFYVAGVELRHSFLNWIFGLSQIENSTPYNIEKKAFSWEHGT